MTQCNKPQRGHCRRISIIFALCLGLLPAGTWAAAPPRDWRDEIIYFVVTDRFADGDSGNNDQGTGEYDPTSEAHYNGGDLAGLRGHLDYIHGLGATALWITPPVLNQWWHPGSRYGGYHGYWASDFSRIDPHLGTVADYRALADDLHRRGMKLVQDVVVNHVGNWLRYDGAWRAGDHALGASLWRDGQGATHPAQWPFSANDPRKHADRRLGIYHWTPDIRDFTDRRQETDWQLSGLDDLDTENPQVRRALRESYGRWIRDIGVDAFRIDTAFHVPPGFFTDFLHSDDPSAPGMARAAKDAGIADFLAFGEGFAIDRAYRDDGARKLEIYLRPPDGRPGLPSMINFPLYGTLGDVFAKGHATTELAWRIESMMRLHADPWRMPTFIDNHDVDRFLAGGTEAGQRQALLAMLALPGIPVIYYGTEQGMRERRPAMFAAGQGSGGRDRLDRDSAGYRWLQRAIALRKAHPALRRAHPRVLWSNPAGPGGIAWRMRAEDEDLLVLLNTADHPVLLDALPLPADTQLVAIYSMRDDQPAATVRAAGGSVWLPARSGYLARLEAKTRLNGQAHPDAPRLDALPGSLHGDTLVHGTARPGDCVQLVVDGAMHGDCMPADARGRWKATLDTAEMIDPAVEHRLVAWTPDRRAVSSPRAFRVERAWTLATEVLDPAGDDHGPDGRYRYPTGEGWDGRHPADLLGARVWMAGGALKIELSMRDTSMAWNPPNGFDHVAFDIFIDLPGDPAGGNDRMPRQHARLPDGMRWDVHARIGGWSNAAFAAAGSDAERDGTALPRAPRIETEPRAKTVTLVFDPALLGRRTDLRGTRVHVTTWDMDGEYRPLLPQAAGNAFGGGDADGPRVMDAIGPVPLR